MTNDIAIHAPMLADYTDEMTPGWTHDYTGHHLVVNGKFGQLEIGVVPGKSWDQWLFHENNGGGSLVIGWCMKVPELEYLGYPREFSDLDIHEGNTPKQLHVMMLKANRFNLIGDGDDYELPGGFVDGNETKLAAAIREALEPDEAGMLTNPTPVSGRGYVGNRAFFQLDSENEGTSVFDFELTSEQEDEASKSDKLVMMPIKDAIRISRDALTGMALARFVADKLL